MKVFEFILCSLRKKKRMRPEAFSSQPIKNIVVINNKRLGDFLFCTPAIKTIKEHSSASKIIVVTSKQNAGLIGDTEFIDEIYFMENTLSDALTIGKTLRSLNPEIGIIFHSKSPYDLIALTVAGVNCLLKHYFGNERKALFKVCDGYVVGGIMPPVINDLELVRMLGFSSPVPEMFFPSKVSAKKTQQLRVGIQLGASGKDRFFPAKTAANVIHMLLTCYPEMEFYLLGVKQESALGIELLNSLDEKTKANVIDLIGKTSILQLAEQINDMAVLITPDTGCLHIATALKTKTVSLFVYRQKNASVPQQDFKKHKTLYACDYPLYDSTLNDGSRLATIPAEQIVKSVVTLIVDKHL
ncbi:glycosyltransferase family 9 protein [Dryocola sp. BD613]|uniref:glycosyltransferase family 9 protein n=1 Tax=Dryocola sp. BD613 TaxID=3133272 RepID=UPI003F50BD16